MRRGCHEWGTGKRESRDSEEVIVFACSKCKTERWAKAPVHGGRPQIVYRPLDGKVEVEPKHVPACPAEPTIDHEWRTGGLLSGHPPNTVRTIGCRRCGIQHRRRQSWQGTGVPTVPKSVYVHADGREEVDPARVPDCVLKAVPPAPSEAQPVTEEDFLGGASQRAPGERGAALVKSGRLLEAQELLSGLCVFEDGEVLQRVRARLRDRVRELGGDPDDPVA